MACVMEFYENDVVYRFNKRWNIEFGVVIDTYESCDAYDTQLLRKGQLLVEWLHKKKYGLSHVVDRSKVHLLSRSVSDGDIVRRLENGKETQRGYCRSIKVRTAVQILGSSQVIDYVSHERLTHVHPFNRDAPVCIGETIGRILHCDYMVKLASHDGSAVEFIPDDSKAYFKHLDHCIEIVPANLKRAKWLRKTWTLKQSMFKPHHFMIQSVKPVALSVAVLGEQHSTFAITLNKEEISHLKVLPTLDAIMPQYNELRYLTVRPSDNPVSQEAWMAFHSARFRLDQEAEAPAKDGAKKKRTPSRYLDQKQQRHYFLRSTVTALPRRTPASAYAVAVSKPKDEDAEWITDDDEEVQLPPCVPPKLSIPFNRPSVVQAMVMDSKATIVWQDGTVEEDVPTTQLYYSISLDDHEFFPGEWVLRSDDQLDYYGVVQKVDYMARTALVKWFTCVDMAEPAYVRIEELSVYDIKRHPMFVFRPGSVVFRMKTCENNLGCVVDSYPEGFVKVRWMDGVEEDCWPQFIDTLTENWGMGDSSEAEELDSTVHSWETESVESVFGGEFGGTEPTWQMLASRLEFMRGRIMYLRQALLTRDCDNLDRDDHLSFLKNLLSVYENSIYLDKLLETQFFSIRSFHYQVLLGKIKEKAREAGVEVRSKLPINSMEDIRAAEMDNINKVMKMEYHLEMSLYTCTLSPSEEQKDAATNTVTTNSGLCVELLSMLKCRMDLAYAEVISRIGGPEALSVLTMSSKEIAAPSPTCTPACSTPIPSFSTTPEDSLTSITTTPPKQADCNLDPNENLGLSTPNPVRPASPNLMPFEMLDEEPTCHRFFENTIEPTDAQRFCRAIINEHVRLSDSLPPGVWVYGFSNRTDLFSVMIRGPDHTPYEDGLFIFDLQLSADYPRTPPHCSYISYNSERLNPNLYVEGRVCVSLLGTWIGRGSEVWGPKSTLLQLIVSIQGLILVAEPYFNEAGYDKQNDTQQGYENSRTYNELVVLRLVQSMTAMLETPHEIFRREIYAHFRANSEKMVRRLCGWIDGRCEKQPEFPLLPASKGLQLSLRSCLDRFSVVCAQVTANQD